MARETSISLGWSFQAIRTIEALRDMDSNARYLTMHLLFNVYEDARRLQLEATSLNYRKAFVEGRLRKRKIKAGVKVWIEPEAQAVRQ